MGVGGIGGRDGGRWGGVRGERVYFVTAKGRPRVKWLMNCV